MDTTADLPEFLTVKEYAAIIRKSTHTVNSWCRDGRLEHRRDPAGNVLIPRRVVEDLYAGQDTGR